MNFLEWYLWQHKAIDPTEAMNALQLNGIISDNAIDPKNVAQADCSRAIKFLDEWKTLKEKKPK